MLKTPNVFNLKNETDITNKDMNVNNPNGSINKKVKNIFCP